MDVDANLEADEARLRAYADELADAIEAAIAPWVERCVQGRLADAGIAPTPDVEAAVREAARHARGEAGAAVHALLGRDIDDQGTNPLSILRDAVVYPTSALSAAGVRPVRRDVDAERLFPDDVYDLTPASFSDVDPSLAEPGMLWGAAKAFVHLARRRAEGRR